MTTKLDQKLFDRLALEASESPRLRSHHNFHQSADAAVQRVLIALQPNTYVAAHSHPQDWKWELLLVLRGELDCLIFDDIGTLIERYTLTPDNSASGVELAAGSWHSIVCTQPDTMLLEIKPGPYDAATAAVMAPWCPLEGDEFVSRCYAWMQAAQIGDRFLAE